MRASITLRPSERRHRISASMAETRARTTTRWMAWPSTTAPTAAAPTTLEFKIQSSTYDASYGRNPGANVNVVTKSGSNQFHGSLFEFFRNEDLNANSFFENRDGGGKQQVFKQNQFGGTIGGPIKKDKIFF